jgi:DNA adenine methylase
MYDGGKNQGGVYHTIINQIPPHKVYIEPFLGSGAIIRNKRPAQINIGIELDHAVINAFHASAGYAVINSCAISCLKMICATCDETTFIYADPPYPKMARRSAADIYKFEMTDEQHVELLMTLLDTKARVAISTYDNPLYTSMLNSWRVVKFNSQTRHGTATELLYMNYQEPERLHDYSFLGGARTRRQSIQRKIERHVNRLLLLPAQERNAIIQAISDRVVINDFTSADPV